MTTTPERTEVDTVTLTIDGVQVSVPKDTLVIRAAEQVGVQIPRFCDHPLLDPVGACRQCLVDIPDAGNGRGFPKPQASCTLPVAEGMVVNTQATSEVADKAQQGVMEFLLINHPLDCPVCDKGGECPLQNQAMSNGRGESRFAESGGVKRTFPKPINISAQVLLDRERCVLCARCTRFSEQVAGDPFIALAERGALQQVAIYEREPFESYFSGNAIQICPVGALTSADYRFRSRPFDLVSTPGVAEHDACGAAIRIDHRRGKVMRRLAGNEPEINEEWISDKDRFAFRYAQVEDRITYPQIREDGELRPASWTEAFAVAARGLRDAGAGAVLTGGRLTAEDAYAYAKFARVALQTNDVDFRARPHSAEEAGFLASHVALSGGVTYADLEAAPVVVLLGLEPEDEAATIFLRLRKAARHGRTQVVSVAPWTSRGLSKMNGRLVPAAPGAETEVIASLADAEHGVSKDAVILVGERLAGTHGALSAAADLAARTGARLAWVPRRAGDRGAVEAGALPNLLPGGRPLAEAAARVDVAAAWGVASLPAKVGRDGNAIVAALAKGDLGGLVVAGVDPDDTADPAAFRAALDAAGFVVSLELRATDVTRVGRRRPPGRADDRQGRHLRHLGRPHARLRRRLHQPRVAARPADPVRHRRRAGRARPGRPAGLPHGRRGARRDAGPRPVGRRPPGARRGQAAQGRQGTQGRFLRARHLEAADRPRLDAGRRGPPPRHRPHPGPPAQPVGVRVGVRGFSARGGARSRPARHRHRRPRQRDPAGGDRRPARRRGLGPGPVLRPRRPRRAGLTRQLGHREGSHPMMSLLPLAAADLPETDLAAFGQDPWWVIALKAVLIFLILVLLTLFNIWFERRVVARMQHRVGPNVHGPFGLLQSLADGVKLALKEDIIPKAADKVVFLLAPIIAVVPAFVTWSVIPLGPEVNFFGHRTPLQLTDMPVAVLFVMAIASIGIYGIVLGGWSSGSTYSLLGGLRSSAQMISYEVAMGLALVAVFLYAGSMSTSEIVAAQDRLWFGLILLPSFVIFVIAMVGETNRAPFDLPEAEGELVGGFHTEYSSLKFALFFLAEYINLSTVSAVATTLFLGGWAAPWGVENVWAGANSGYWPLIWFFGKMFLFIFMFVWLRGSLPRMRYDQFMALGWKVLIPVSLAWTIAVATIRVISLEAENGINRSYLVAAIAVLLVLTVALMFVGEGKDDSEPVEVSQEPHDAFAGGFPVPPMPAGGAVRGAAEPLSFAHSPGGRTTVTASAEENHE